jgi:hypothetical protein
MKKFLIVLIAVAVLVVTISLSVIAASVFSVRREEQKSQNTAIASESDPIAQATVPEKEVSATEYLYILKKYNGCIGVFNAGESVPFKVIDTDVSLLPSFDRIALEDGIEIYTEEELDAIIEDFDS